MSCATTPTSSASASSSAAGPRAASSGRSGPWLLNALIIAGCVRLGDLLGNDRPASLCGLAVLLATLGATVRRLHDIGRSGWWTPAVVVPLIGWVWLLVMPAGPRGCRQTRFCRAVSGAHARRVVGSPVYI
ncbi:DUF805 domain-containing protein, partial [Streptomyces sp. NPDC058612]